MLSCFVCLTLGLLSVKSELRIRTTLAQCSAWGPGQVRFVRSVDCSRAKWSRAEMASDQAG
jgi:hypothetical protein